MFGVARHNMYRPPYVSSGGQLIALYDWTTGGLAAGWSYGGGANGTKWNAAGHLVAGSAGRVSYDPASLVCKGLLLEEARTNYTLQSLDLSNAAWSPYSMTVTGNSTASPDGTVNAAQLTAPAAGSFSASADGPTAAETLLAPAHAAASCFVKDISAGFAFMACRPSSNNYFSSNFDITTPAVSGAMNVGATSGTGIMQRIDAVGGGWMRMMMAGFTGDTLSYSPDIDMTQAGGVGNGGGINTNGDIFYSAASAFSIYAWQYQLEQGDFPSSPIPTTSAPVTRSGDTASIALPVNVNAMVLTGTTAIYIGSGQTQILAQWDDGTDTNYVRVIRNALNEIHVQSSTGADLNLGTVAHYAAFKLAVRFFSGDFAASLNGAAVVTGSSVMPAVNTLRAGSNVAGTSYWMGHLGTAAWWSTLSNADLQAKST
jgi:hypothetical protein